MDVGCWNSGEVSMEMQAGSPALRRIRSGSRRALAGRAVWSQSPSGSVRGQMRAGGKAGGRKAWRSLVTNLGHREGVVQEDQRSAVTEAPCRGHGSPSSLGRQRFLCPEAALIPALWPGTPGWNQALLYTHRSATNAKPAFEIKKPTENMLSGALFPSDGGFLVAAANLSHWLCQRGGRPQSWEPEPSPSRWRRQPRTKAGVPALGGWCCPKLASHRVPGKHSSGCGVPTHAHPRHCLHRWAAPTASRPTEGSGPGGTPPVTGACPPGRHGQQGDSLVTALGSVPVHETRCGIRGPVSSGAFSMGLLV